MTEISLRQIKDRDQMIRFFDGYAYERIEDLSERNLRRPLVKTHLLEFLNGQDQQTPERVKAILLRYDVRLEPLEERLFLVSDDKAGDIGFLECLDTRVVALYSTMDAKDLDSWTNRLVSRSPEIDHVWLSGLTFGVLWELVVRLSEPHRFTRLVFTHRSIFEIDNPRREIDENEEEGTEDTGEDEPEAIYERRATSFRLVDRVGQIKQKLKALQELYSPLYAISQLRFPSPVGRGGHDFYDNGRVTNRSESFRDHRSHVLFVVRIYERLLKSTEQYAWYSIQESVGVPGQFGKIVGAPIVVQFQEPLAVDVFSRWISVTFGRKNNCFRLWGHPLWLGPTKVHVYGVDRHLWHPLFLELTAKGLIAIIPNGTCGNTVHRLVTNIQRYLDPGARAFIGDRPYEQIVEESAQGVAYGSDGE